jgi:hypothetical protein
MSLIASCGSAQISMIAPVLSSDTCNRHAVPVLIDGQAVAASSNISDVPQTIPGLDQWRGCFGEDVKWMTREWHIIER